MEKFKVEFPLSISTDLQMVPDDVGISNFHLHALVIAHVAEADGVPLCVSGDER